MRVKHQPYINPILASWFVPFGTYRNILISHMPHTAAWKTKPASTFWVWNTLQARAVGYLWIILLDLLPFLAFNECSHYTELSHANPRDDTATREKYVQLTLGKSSPSRQKLSPYQANLATSAVPQNQGPSWFRPYGFVPFKPALPKNISKNNCQMSHMHLVLTGNREVGVPSPGANLVQLARGGFCNSPLRWSRFTLMLNNSQQSLLM